MNVLAGTWPRRNGDSSVPQSPRGWVPIALAVGAHAVGALWAGLVAFYPAVSGGKEDESAEERNRRILLIPHSLAVVAAGFHLGHARAAGTANATIALAGGRGRGGRGVHSRGRRLRG